MTKKFVSVYLTNEDDELKKLSSKEVKEDTV